MVANLSPLRYPGGKTKLYSYIKEVITHNQLNGCTYVEPFAGGAGLALKLLVKKDVSFIVINDFDYAIYAFWHSVLNRPDDFCERIHTQTVDMNYWHYYKTIYDNQSLFDIFEVGFATFFLNRTNRSGIICGGVIGGRDQQGKYKIDCRFNRNALIEKIQIIKAFRPQIALCNLDATDLIKNHLPAYDSRHTFVYLDPPYVKKGCELYQNFFCYNDHATLYSATTSTLQCPWLVTYDVTTDISGLYAQFRQEIIDINYSAGTNKKGSELAIYSNNLIIPSEAIKEFAI